MTLKDTIITLSITDDHTMVREGLIRMLQNNANIKILDTYPNGRYLMEGLKEKQPDVLLLDLQLEDTMGGHDLVPLIKKNYPAIKIIILSSNDNFYTIRLLLNAGVNGYLLKNSAQRLLVEAIESVYQGKDFFAPRVEEILQYGQKKKLPQKAGKELLTPREKDILKLITEEYTSQEIADALNLSLRTVETYRLGIMQKLGVKNMVGMTKKAILLGII
jgi:DNA-binding NarL/FixJ family response regulator